MTIGDGLVAIGMLAFAGFMSWLWFRPGGPWEKP